MRTWETKTDNTAPASGGILPALEDNTRGKELENAVKLFGITLDATTGADSRTNMLAEAMSRSASYGTFGVTSGTANALVLTEASVGVGLSVVAPKALFTGMRVHTTTPLTNTGPTTANVFGLGVKKVLTAEGVACAGGELSALGDTVWEYDATLDSAAGAWRILSWTTRISPSVIPGYPEILTASNVFAFTTTTGQIIINDTQAFLHRTARLLSTGNFLLADRTFATAVSKTYHLRWYAPGHANAPLPTYPFGRFMLQDLASGTYNPGAAAESSSIFDTTYDDMLVARVVTNGANSLTVTALKNKVTLVDTAIRSVLTLGPSWTDLANAGHQLSATINWSRTPKVSIAYMSVDATLGIEGLVTVLQSFTRYSGTGMTAGYADSEPFITSYVSGKLTLELFA